MAGLTTARSRVMSSARRLVPAMRGLVPAAIDVSDRIVGDRTAARVALIRFPQRISDARVRAWLQRNYSFPLSGRRPMQATVTVRGGARMHVSTDDIVQRTLLVSSTWEPHTTPLVEALLRPGTTFVDVGAHVGYYTLLASTRVGPSGRVLAIEPSTAAADALRENVRLSGITNVVVEQVAIAEQAGEARLYLSPDPGNPGSTTLAESALDATIARSHRDRADVEFETVPTSPLADLLTSIDPSVPTVIKIDVEGFERAALESLGTLLEDGFAELALVAEVTPNWSPAGTVAWLQQFIDQHGFQLHVVHNDYAVGDLFPQRPAPPIRSAVVPDHRSDLILVRGDAMRSRLDSPVPPPASANDHRQVGRPLAIGRGFALRSVWFAAELSRLEFGRPLLNGVVPRLRHLRGDLELRRACRDVGPPPAPESGGALPVLMIDWGLPNPLQDSGSDRIVRLSRMAALQGHPTRLLSFHYRLWVDIEPTAADDISLPEPQVWRAAEFREMVRTAGVIWLSRPEVAGRLLPSLDDARADRTVLFDTTDLYYLRLRRQAQLTGDRSAAVASALFRRLERLLFANSDLTLLVTPDEAAIVTGTVPSAVVAVIPNVHETRSTPVPPLEGRSGLLFVGNYRHVPNIDAVRQLMDVILPRVRERLPEAGLTIVGDRLPADLAERVQSGVTVLGWVEDLDPVLDAAVAMAAPLRYGAGMKGKLGLAMAKGLPIVTTGIGAEGMDLADGTTALVADDIDDYVDRCVQILTDPELWTRLSQTARAHVEANFSATAVDAALARVLSAPTT